MRAFAVLSAFRLTLLAAAAAGCGARTLRSDFGEGGLDGASADGGSSRDLDSSSSGSDFGSTSCGAGTCPAGQVCCPDVCETSGGQLQTLAPPSCVVACPKLVLPCSADDSGARPDSGGGSENGQGSGSAGGSTPVSYSMQVLPILVRACAFSSCHNGSASGLVVLGDKAICSNMCPSYEAGMIYTNLMGTSTEANPMPFITKGDPTKSFLYLKIAGVQTSANCLAGNSLIAMYAAQCGCTSPCGGQMPEMQQALSPDAVDTIRTWIAQGALQD